MKTENSIIFLLFLAISFSANSQPDRAVSDTLNFQGQASIYLHFNPDNKLPFAGGIRYIPQLNYGINFKKNHIIDFEASANIFGNSGVNLIDSIHYDGKIKPYRLWGRFTSSQFELRIGLQKINFGSASLIRPLMWFEQIDARDPLRLTDGVYALLARYYFKNNANIWFWTLYGNKNLKGWEYFHTVDNTPEIGGRFQLPLKKGEMAFSYNYRQADGNSVKYLPNTSPILLEHKAGFDIKLDLKIGCWLETSWAYKNKIYNEFQNQKLINIGVDYTFGIGSGLSVLFEQLFIANDEKAFEFKKPVSLSLINFSYPVSLLDNLSVIGYYSYFNNDIYSFFNWSHQFKRLTMYVMIYANPATNAFISNSAMQNVYSGNGLQLMFVYNH